MSLFEAAVDSVTSGAECDCAKDFSRRGPIPESKFEPKLLDYPLNRTSKMLSGLATYRLTLGQARPAVCRA